MPLERTSRYISWRREELPTSDNVLEAAMSSALCRDLPLVLRKSRKARLSSNDSIYVGAVGAAFMQYHVCPKNINIPVDASHLCFTGDTDLARILRQNPIGNPPESHSSVRISFLESQIGIATLVLARCQITSEQTILDNVPRACRLLHATVKSTLLDKYFLQETEDGCEVLYGRAGLLYALLYLRQERERISTDAQTNIPEDEFSALRDLLSDETISLLVDSIMARGKHGSQVLLKDSRTRHGVISVPPLMWKWHGKRYLGGAHGVAGILQIVLNCPFSALQKHITPITETLMWLINCQDVSGNWPTKYGSENGSRTPSGASSKDLVQYVAPFRKNLEICLLLLSRWCHGASGMIILLSTALRVFGNHSGIIPSQDTVKERIRTSVRRASSLVYERGLLCKGVGLCHGTAGSVYALLGASSALDTAPDREWLKKAAHLAYLATYHEEMTSCRRMVVPDRRWSLYEGLAGMCCAWAEVLRRLDSDRRFLSSGMPGFDDLTRV
ncbi:hypothetical protein B0H34DRAFT_534833 [Crassisporium funariophilum]|nr:hypothetical protein B0H34DRAFT_534833 [Crassisporium funariophilum]